MYIKPFTAIIASILVCRGVKKSISTQREGIMTIGYCEKRKQVEMLTRFSSLQYLYQREFHKSRKGK